jgi:putative membrane protein
MRVRGLYLVPASLGEVTMRYLHLAVIVIFAAIILIFAAQNFQLVKVSFLSISFETRLALLIVLIYIFGALTGGSVLALLRQSIHGARRHTAAPP